MERDPVGVLMLPLLVGAACIVWLLYLLRSGRLSGSARRSMGIRLGFALLLLALWGWRLVAALGGP